MAVLTEELQGKLEQLLINGGSLTSETLEEHRKSAKAAGTP